MGALVVFKQKVRTIGCLNPSYLCVCVCVCVCFFFATQAVCGSSWARDREPAPHSSDQSLSSEKSGALTH